MKKILIGTFLTFSLTSTFANEPLKEVSEVVELPNMAQKQIYDASKIWMAKAFKSSNAVIQYEDTSTGTIIGKGNMQYPCKGTWSCMANANNLLLFTVKIDTKDNKARLTFNDLLLKTKGGVTGGIIVQSVEIGIFSEKEKEVVESGLKQVIATYKQDLQNQKNDNW